jgi:two-component system, cell cycle sensor histidine kinase and response regulator CckA
MQTILVLDDEPGVLRLVSVMLEKKGYRVLSAANGDQALRLCDVNPQIDLLLTDVIAPGMSGPMIADQVLERQPGIKVLFMSGYEGTQVVQRYVVERGHALIVKPFTVPDLARKVESILSGSPPDENV